MTRVTVVAPHPDDETLGCGGTLLRHLEEGDEVSWCIVTSVTAEGGFDDGVVQRRREEIAEVGRRYGFAETVELGFPTTTLGRNGLGPLVTSVSAGLARLRPEVLYLPSPGDIHSDHRATFEACASATKWFRTEGLRRILAYETLSETHLDIDPKTPAFRPSVFVDISSQLEAKIDIMALYAGELGEFPFPRSVEAIRALAAHRGSSSGLTAAEAFMLLREVMP